MQLVPDNYQSESKGLIVTAAPGLKIEDYNDSIIANLIERDISLKAAQKYRIKQSAKTKIEALAWRVDRAREREEIGVNGEKLHDVFRLKEAIRNASNRIESEIDELTDDAEIRSMVLNVTDQDKVAPRIIPKLHFLKRFTSTERGYIRTAVKSGNYAKVEDWWDLMSFSSNVDLDDKEVIAVLGVLESNGVLATGRKDVILV